MKNVFKKMAVIFMSIVCLASVSANVFADGVRVNIINEKFVLPDGPELSETVYDKILKWAESNTYPEFENFIKVLSDDDVAMLVKLFESEVEISSTKFSPIVVEDKSEYLQKTVLVFPFEGEFFVAQGNRSWISHKKDTSNEFALDFVIQKKGGMVFGNSAKNEKYFAWGKPVLAPADGVVLAIRDGNEDHPPLTTALNKSNFVKIQHENGEVSNIHHLMNGSIIVKEGQKVLRGEMVGKVGDSGISMFPHIHYQLDRISGDKINYAPVVFSCYFARHKDEKNWHLVINGIPQEGEYVASPEAYIEMRDKTAH